MTILSIEQFLFWCMIINFGLMSLSMVLITMFRPMAQKIHCKLFHVSEDYVNMAIHAFLGLYKLLVFFFVVVPWIALRIIAH